jgi:hypothetical protein
MPTVRRYMVTLVFIDPSTGMVASSLVSRHSSLPAAWKAAKRASGPRSRYVPAGNPRFCGPHGTSWIGQT